MPEAITIGVCMLLIALLLRAHTKERKELLDRIGEIVDFTAQERGKLLNRIQHPQRVQLPDPTVYETPEPPRDAGELAQVGQIVPDYIHVGENGEQSGT